MLFDWFKILKNLEKKRRKNDRGMFLGGGNEQIFDWWGVTCPITSSRENPRD